MQAVATLPGEDAGALHLSPPMDSKALEHACSSATSTIFGEGSYRPGFSWLMTSAADGIGNGCSPATPFWMLGIGLDNVLLAFQGPAQDAAMPMEGA